MPVPTATGLNPSPKSTAAKGLHAGRLNIGPRLMAGFLFVILSMCAADAAILWQFHLARAQAMRLRDVDQKLVALLRAHTSVLAFYERLDTLADAEDANGLAAEAGLVRTTVLQDIHRATNALSRPPFSAHLDPTILPTLQVIQSELPSQINAITTLATSGDWRAVHLRLLNQLKPLESLTSALVEKIDREAGEQQAEAVMNIRRVERLIFWVVPLTAVLALLICVTLGIAITRSITRPLALLVDASKALARGEFQHQVSVTGSDELAHLGQVFNDTARHLHHLYRNLQEREARIRRLVDANIVGIFIWKKDGQIVEANEAFLHLVGYCREDLVSGRLRWTDLTPPDWHDVDEQAAAEVKASGSLQPYEKEYFRKNGSRVPVLLASALFEGGGNEGVAFVLDLSERKRADAERERLRQLEADLAHVNRVSMLGELAASLAHELKQPIAAATTNANTCLRWLARSEPDLQEAREAAARIVKDGNRAAKIIDRLRSFYRKEAPAQRELVNVDDVVREMFALLRCEADRYSISLHAEPAAGVPQVSADRVQLQQVFMNLMLNGIEAMKETGGDLTVQSQLGEAGHLLISVIDTGVGLPAGKADQIFNAFFTTKPQGSGMGLAISRSIMESHGGRLWAADNYPCGARFCFTLPTNFKANE
jgi:PAS domain S-box-containing protein